VGLLDEQAGDPLVDPWPEADVVTLARILHDWAAPTRRRIFEKARHAVPEGGAVIVCEALIDDGRRTNAHALLTSLHMLLQTAAGFESAIAECAGWMHEAGFARTQPIPLLTPFTALMAIA
jgi:O-methyltransferase domain